MDRITCSAVDGSDGLQSTRASISPQSGESTVGQVWRRVQDQRDQHLLRINTMLSFILALSISRFHI
jgi:hypothetical protein